MKKSIRHNAGFTLLEIMLVVCIIGLLIGMGVKMMGGKLQDARMVRAQGDLEGLKASLVSYQIAANTLPTTEQGLQALLAKPEGVRNWRGPYAEPSQLVDPWNKAYIYVQPGSHNPKAYDIYSAGPDGQPNTDDDIGNWEAPATK
jgi:general secretion pathway protein G